MGREEFLTKHIIRRSHDDHLNWLVALQGGVVVNFGANHPSKPVAHRIPVDACVVLESWLSCGDNRRAQTCEPGHFSGLVPIPTYYPWDSAILSGSL